MTDAGANPRHKIEAINELRQTAIRENTERLPESERFIIKIDLSAGGGPIEVYDKPIKPDAPARCCRTFAMVLLRYARSRKNAFLSRGLNFG